MADKNKKQKNVTPTEKRSSSLKNTNLNSKNAGSSNTTTTALTLALKTKDGNIVLNLLTESSKQQHTSQHQTKSTTTTKPHSNQNTNKKNPPHNSKTHPNLSSGQKNSPSTSKANTNSNNSSKNSSNTSKTHSATAQKRSPHHSNTNSVQKIHNQPPKANPNLSAGHKHPPPSFESHSNHHIQKKSLKNTFKPHPKFNTKPKINPHAFITPFNGPIGHVDFFPDFTIPANWPIGYKISSASSNIPQNLNNSALDNSPVPLLGSRDHSPRPQYDDDLYQINKNVLQEQEPRPRHNTNENEFNCPTCKALYLPHIYQCASGHSSCSSCKENSQSCGICEQVITDMRNFTLEEYLAEKKVPCPNEGCKLFIKMLEVDSHNKECPFGILTCPAGCSYKMPLKQLSAHFDDRHMGQRLEGVGSEIDLRYIYEASQKMYLIQLGGFHFLFHEWVSPEDRRIYMAAQLIGTKVSASKWFYEIHIYAKNEPRRLYTFSEICTSFVEPVAEVFNQCKCCILTQTRAVTFLNNSAVNYKVFIKKTVESTSIAADFCD